MNILQIYKNYKIPPNLQEHMLRVASIGILICDNWNGETQLKRDKIITALLLHDMGNIIKFNFALPHLYGDE